MFKKLTGLPVPKAGTHQNVPFSMSAMTYHQANNEDMWTSERMGVVDALRRGCFVIHINHDRTFELYRKEDTDQNDILFVSEGEHDKMHVICIDHNVGKVFGYDERKGQFFYVKLHERSNGARIIVHDRQYDLKDFLT